MGNRLVLLAIGLALASPAARAQPTPQNPPATVAQPAPAQQNAPKSAPAKQAVPKGTPSTPADDRNCVGVVSNFGETFTVKKVGIVVFQNEENKVPIESWRIDDLVVAKVSGVLNKRAAVRRVTAPKGAFSSLDAPQPFRNYDSDLGALLRTVTAGTRCPRYIVVTRGSTGYGNSNQVLNGLGIVASSALMGGFQLHALAGLRVYSGETFAVAKQKSLSSGQSTFMTGIHGPHREVDKSFWPDPADAAQQNSKLREATRDLVGQSLDKTLPELLAN
jgi:hypothetical protein